MKRTKSLAGKVIVITGASSGLGRAAAVELGRRGCRVVLGARREDALEETAQLCRAAGGEALVVETDVTKEDDVKNLAEQALTMTGRIDAWVNNAGVTAFGALEDGSFDVHRRVIETNVFGAMYGARAAIPIFKRQGAGILVNVSSTLGKLGQPYVPSYVVSKFAVRGLSETLRTEFADHPDIHVCTLLPYAFDSPHFESGANRIGFEAHPMPPQQTPEKVARALVSIVERPRREVHVPSYARVGIALHALFPATVERLVLHLVREWHFGFAPEGRKAGNLFSPPSGEASKGMHGTRRARVSLPGMLAWTVAHFARLPRSSSLRPHSA